MEQDLKCLSKAVRLAIAAGVDRQTAGFRRDIVLKQQIRKTIDSVIEGDPIPSGPGDGIERLDGQRRIAPDAEVGCPSWRGPACWSSKSKRGRRPSP